MNSKENKRKAPLTTIEMDENGALVYKENAETKESFFLHANSSLNVSLVDLEYNKSKQNITPELFVEMDRDEASLLFDKRIIDTYQRIVDMRDIVNVDVREFINGFINTILENVKFAHKAFKVNIKNDGRLDLYLDHILTIYVVALSILNDINNSSTINIDADIRKRGVVVSFSTMVEREDNLYSISSIVEEYPKLAARLSYLDCLCSEDGNGMDVSILGGELKFTFEIMEARIGKDTLHQAPMGQLNHVLLAELMSVFFA